MSKFINMRGIKNVLIIFIIICSCSNKDKNVGKSYKIQRPLQLFSIEYNIKGNSFQIEPISIDSFKISYRGRIEYLTVRQSDSNQKKILDLYNDRWLMIGQINYEENDNLNLITYRIFHKNELIQYRKSYIEFLNNQTNIQNFDFLPFKIKSLNYYNPIINSSTLLDNIGYDQLPIKPDLGINLIQDSIFTLSNSEILLSNTQKTMFFRNDSLKLIRLIKIGNRVSNYKNYQFSDKIDTFFVANVKNHRNGLKIWEGRDDNLLINFQLFRYESLNKDSLIIENQDKAPKYNFNFNRSFQFKNLNLLNIYDNIKNDTILNRVD